jgi:hypothetical protein
VRVDVIPRRIGVDLDPVAPKSIPHLTPVELVELIAM